MGFRLETRSESWLNESRAWIGARKGFDTCRSITLDLALFDFTTVFTDGVIPSGVVLGKVTATGLYGPYSTAAVNGLETALGFLFNTQSNNGDGTGPVAVPLFWEGIVKESKLPANHGLDAAARAELPTIRFEA